MASLTLEHLRDRVIAADPGLGRLRTALRATLTAVLATLILSQAAGWVGEPSALALIGVMVAMIGVVIVSGQEEREQQVTMLLLPVVASAVVVLGALVAGIGWLSVVIFLCVIFVAVIARRFGPRGMALGMIAFMGYFVAVYFHAAFAQLPWIIAGIALATVIAFAVKFWIVRERPLKVVESTVRAFRAQVELLLDDLAMFIRWSAPSKRQARRIRSGLGTLNELALTLDAQVGAFEEPGPSDAQTAWAVSLFEVELATETLADVFLRLAERELSEDARSRLVAMVDGLHDFVRTGDARARKDAERALAAVPECANEPNDSMELACWRMGRVIRVLCEHRPWALEVPSGVELSVSAPGSAVMGSAAGGARASGERIPPDVRLAIQATIASALAIGAGRLLSSTRWYWAVIAAFVVFIRATTLGETISRGWQRVLGTVVGVIAGLIVAHVVAKDLHVALVLIFVSIFATYYFIQRSYSWAIMFITIMLALLYRVLGRYQPQLMYLRLEETVIGVILGAAVAAFVFPSHSREKIRALAADVLRTARTPVADATEHPHREDEQWELLSSVRDVDRAWQALRQATTPLTRTGLPKPHPAVTRRTHDVSLLAYCVRHLVPLPWECVSDGEAKLVGDVGARLVHNLSAVADAVDDEEHPRVRSASDLIQRLRSERGRGTDGATARMADWLDRIDRVVMDLARSEKTA